jgi:hypothetical protein
MIPYIKRQRIKEYRGEPVKYAQAKLDGHYVEVYKDGGDVIIFGKKREENYWPKLREIRGIADPIMEMHSGTAFQAELHTPGVHATSVPTLLNDADQRLTLTPFALHRYNDHLMDTDTGFEWVHNFFERYGLQTPYTRTLVGEARALTQREQDDLLADAVNGKLEGWVLKESHLEGWYKLKPVRTVDCVVVDTKMSESDSFYGGLKSIIVAVRNPETQRMQVVASVGSGFEAE